ncbi:MAG: M20/M25/M40 family metallo-hydrolase [Firmicutes bacterium]|nr:M20/M25/M40 family metallo-hydrolase [Bacillota bacterium]
MKERIFEVLSGLVACPSISGTTKEQIAENYVYDFLKAIPYFQEHPEYCGLHKIPNDPFGRAVPWAMVLGNKKDTVIYSGHIDVVVTDVYGEAEPFCFNMDGTLEEKLKTMTAGMNEQQKADLASGEWIWGRGTADMKGGVAIAMCLVEKYAALAQKGELEGSILFSAVADEECYSAGMRAIMPVYLKLREQYGLNFKLLVDPEPASEQGPKQVLSLGSVGKTMPVFATQGVLAHTGHIYNGISALNMMTGLYKRTNGSLKFVDAYEGESSMPPGWFKLRDNKVLYDVSLPFRSFGYMSVLSFDRTLDRILAETKQIAIEVFEEEVKRLNDEYQEFKKLNKFETKEKIDYPTTVYTVNELRDELLAKDGEKFETFYENLKEEAGKRVGEGEAFPDATVWMLDQLLNYADFKTPVILIGVAPPYYPATHSDMIPGREGYGTKVYEFAKKLSEEKFGQELTYEHYFTGISDNSYTSLPEMDYDALAANYPMWGKSYSLDLEAIKEISVPSILYGPIGREYHQWTERVNKRSLLEVMPEMIQSVTEFAWKN